MLSCYSLSGTIKLQEQVTYKQFGYKLSLTLTALKLEVRTTTLLFENIHVFERDSAEVYNCTHTETKDECLDKGGLKSPTFL
jgi:hypothetical protein